MNAEIETYSRQLRSLLEQVCGSLEELSEAQLNWRSPMEGANSAYVIATHVLGNARAWVLGIACGQPVQRDRAAEFRASGSYADLLAAARLLSDKIGEALGTLSPSSLDRRRVPPQSLWGAAEPREISPREALLEVVEHASLHLGHLQITRDLALQGSLT